MQRKGVSVRFRKDLDADLVQATEGLSKNVLSDMCRNGLRLMLGIKTARSVEVHERPILPIHSQPRVIEQHQQTIKLEEKEKTAPSRTRPAVFIPGQKRL